LYSGSWKSLVRSVLINAKNCSPYFLYLFTIFFCIFQIWSQFNLGFFHIISHFSLLFFHIFPIFWSKLILSWIVKWYGKYGRKVSWKVKRYGKYGKKANWIVKWYVKYGRKVSWIVKRYEKCKRKIGWIVKWYGKYGIKSYPNSTWVSSISFHISAYFSSIFSLSFDLSFFIVHSNNKWIRHKFYNLEMSSPLVTS
jgi:hypothetical protein